MCIELGRTSSPSASILEMKTLHAVCIQQIINKPVTQNKTTVVSVLHTDANLAQIGLVPGHCKACREQHFA